VTLVVVEELQRLLLVREELNSREGAIVTWKDGLTTAGRTLGKACAEREAEHTQTKAI
jgi:hypothetical protein